jgi:hypothetical protein
MAQGNNKNDKNDNRGLKVADEGTRKRETREGGRA